MEHNLNQALSIEGLQGGCSAENRLRVEDLIDLGIFSLMAQVPF